VRAGGDGAVRGTEEGVRRVFTAETPRRRERLCAEKNESGERGLRVCSREYGGHEVGAPREQRHEAWNEGAVEAEGFFLRD